MALKWSAHRVHGLRQSYYAVHSNEKRTSAPSLHRKELQRSSLGDDQPEVALRNRRPQSCSRS